MNTITPWILLLTVAVLIIAAPHLRPAAARALDALADTSRDLAASLHGPILTRDASGAPADADKRAYDFDLRFDRASVDDEKRTITASLSSELAIGRWDGDEVLRHSKEAVDLGRAVHGLPLLFNHDRDRPLGVVRNLRIDGDRLVGDLQFAASAHALEVWEQVRDGYLSNMSIGYRVAKWDVDEDANLHTATRWSLLEASVVTVPADVSVGVGRAMHAAAQNAAGGAAHVSQRNDDDGTVVNFAQTRATALAEGRAEGARLERERIEGIRGLFARERFQTRGYLSLRDDLIAQGVAVDTARERLLEALGDGVEPVTSAARDDDDGRGRAFGGSATPGADQLDKFREGAGQMLAVRAQLITDPEELRAARSNEFHGMTLSEVAREYLRRCGDPLRGMTKMDVIGQAFLRFMPGQGSSHFANVLTNTSEKALMVGWSSSPETWERWTKRGSLSNFLAATRTAISGFGSLDEIPESGEYKMGTFADLKETIQLVKYGKLFNISREAILNDDLGAFTAIPMEMGAAAARKVGDVAYAALTSNPTLAQDSVALFHAASHANLVTSGAAPSVTTYNAMISAMKLQRAPSPDGVAGSGHRIGIGPRFVLAPVALEATVMELRANAYDPAGTAGTLKANPHQAIEPITDPRLDDFDPAAWFGIADPAMGATIEVAFLDGNSTPYVEQQDGWTVDGVSHKVRVEAAAAALDYRFAYRNDGN